MMIFLKDHGTYIFPEHVTMIKEAEDGDKCVLYFVGQSALEGHVIDLPAKQVAEVIQEELYGFEDEGDDFEEEDENEDHI